MKARWYPLVALGVLVVVDQFQGQAFFVLGPEVSDSLGLGTGALAAISAAKTLAITAAALPFAALVQRGRRRARVARLTAWAWSAATLATGFVTTPIALLAILVADGASTGSVGAVHPPLLVDSYPPESRVRALSAYQTANSVGNLVAPLLVSICTAWLALTWRGTFAVLGGVSLLACVVAAGLRDPGIGASEPEASEVSLGFFEIVQRLLLIETVKRVLACAAVLGMMLIPLYTYLFFFLDERWGMGPGARGLFLALLPLFTLPALAWFGRRGDAWLRDDPAVLARQSAKILAAGVVLLAASVLSRSFVGMVLCAGLAFAALAVLQPATNALLFAVVPPRMRPHASALYGICVAAVGGLGGIIFLTGLDRRFGVSGAIVSLAVPGLAAALILDQARATVGADVARLAQTTDHRTPGSRRAPLLEVRGVDFSYGRLQVLFDVDLRIDEGEKVALLGTNGAGKSTLLKVVSGVALPQGGTVRLDGQDITYVDAERRVGLGIAQVSGGRAVFPGLTVHETLRVCGHLHRRDKRLVEARIDDAFAAFPALATRRDTVATSLSGGEQQMLALAKTFLLRPRLVCIDELSIGLAPKVVGELLAMVRRLNDDGTAVILVEQSLNVALATVEHAYFMEKGAIRFDGRAADLRERPDLLRAVFLGGAAAALDDSSLTRGGRSPVPS